MKSYYFDLIVFSYNKEILLHAIYYIEYDNRTEYIMCCMSHIAQCMGSEVMTRYITFL